METCYTTCRPSPRRSTPRRGIVAVSWLPIYHDMGLIGGILGTLYGCGSLTLLSPKRFQEQPLSWLQAISKYGATHAGGPNFAYDWCLRRTTPEMREATRFEFLAGGILRRRTDPRGDAGSFQRGLFAGRLLLRALRPCYGLAEATLMVAARKKTDPLLAVQVSRRALEQGEFSVADGSTPQESLAAIASGPVVGSQRVVDCRSRNVPRVSLRSDRRNLGARPSVASGYWKRPELSAAVFEARLADTGEGPFLRTGDLGCFHEGQLFVTGRIKDLIIVRGRNHYPQDIEFTAQSSHADLQAGGGVAFSLDQDGEEQIVLVHEVRREAIRSLDAGRRDPRNLPGRCARARSTARRRRTGSPRQHCPHDQRQVRTSDLSPTVRCRRVRIHRASGNRRPAKDRSCRSPTRHRRGDGRRRSRPQRLAGSGDAPRPWSIGFRAGSPGDWNLRRPRSMRGNRWPSTDSTR